MGQAKENGSLHKSRPEDFTTFAPGSAGVFLRCSSRCLLFTLTESHFFFLMLQRRNLSYSVRFSGRRIFSYSALRCSPLLCLLFYSLLRLAVYFADGFVLKPSLWK